MIEAIIKDLAIKQTVFCELESLLAENVILATNTSSFDLNKMGRVLKRPQNFVGMHIFNPSPIMALLEIVRSQHTYSAVTDTVFKKSESGVKVRFTYVPVRVLSSIVLHVLFIVKRSKFSKKLGPML